jgi:hypothetical protein
LAEARISAEITAKKIDPKWCLSRMHRDKPGAPGWTDTERFEHSGKDGGPIQVDAVSWRDKMLEMAAEAEGEGESEAH